MASESLSHSDLILNPDGSIYHLNLHPEEISPTIILVGDPGRVKEVSAHFDEITHVKAKREFLTHTGLYRKSPVSVISTGIGTDNIDIVLNELDALVNVDLERRLPKEEHTSLRLIRLGTSGAIHPDIHAGNRILSRVACGFDGLIHFYRKGKAIQKKEYSKAFMAHCSWPESMSYPYFVACSPKLYTLFEKQKFPEGITISSPGFYAPQLRKIRMDSFDDSMLGKIMSFRYNNQRILNFEMECSALYALSSMLGHDALTMCVAVANRINKTFLEDYHRQVDTMIIETLDKLFPDE